MNPYKVLGVAKRSGDEQIKNAYRRLTKKYHPDKHVGMPDEKEAEKRMKEINEAYAAIVESRKQKKAASVQKKAKRTGVPIYCPQNGTLYQRIRQEIKLENLRMALILLQRVSQRDAEWYFLSGEVYFSKKWYEEAEKAYEKAFQANPQDPDYRAAREKMKKIPESERFPQKSFSRLLSKFTAATFSRRAKTNDKKNNGGQQGATRS